MKLSTIAKTSLALGILTTGVITTNAQSVDAEVKSQVENKNNSDEVQKLRDYYNKHWFDYRNQTGYKEGDKLSVVDSRTPQQNLISLLGKDKERFNKDTEPNIDVFVVKENSDRDTVNESIGGITQTNKENYSDYVTNPPITLTESNGDVTTSDYIGRHRIDKEEISLKELDFKLRKQLIKDHGLYTGNKKDGVIVVKMKGNNENDKYSFELDKKLQDHRMGDVVDSKNIKEITVEFK
ncbi:exotoxin beta-grasp domain-containing protein [Staphylococcus agnetis]|uniref:exotoxin beta-grasp domain-containing protein n=1 Tax=Staphylococcus agnetis TaxID=985762 RepID=UPI000D1AE4D2|nr:superantigen-like protein [Staphylococcus agnetis]PTH57786.1 superantigen-like protein [Staphylococcus agnetis]